jgi:hypothetical protein
MAELIKVDDIKEIMIAILSAKSLLRQAFNLEVLFCTPTTPAAID